MPQQAEKEIIQLLKEGNLTTFNQVFNTLYFPLYFYCRKYISSPEDAKDLIQNVFLRFWDKKEEISIEVSVKAYLFRSVQNECLNYLRSAHLNVSYFETENGKVDCPDSSCTPDVEIENRELEHVIYSILEELPLQCKKIFIMSRLKGLKNKEIAKILAISVRTVDTQIYRALKIFKTKLKNHLAINLIGLIILFLM
ncbi:RNA polymerase sigma-70 factor [Parabacteroides sp. Marseille-P3160]|uniref:RNA polymerase sigma-70 factor n=1 Tax=Parabacteroides sp. Marseille-P3160 TaxID=1917887 RepID=UPI0009B99AA3|nr:RNA polymerase sigma-70 factor [Parabacteroides sp. Marseille-P3160]